MALSSISFPTSQVAVFQQVSPTNRSSVLSFRGKERGVKIFPGQGIFHNFLFLLKSFNKASRIIEQRVVPVFLLHIC
jgi:hypothetical protein